MTDDRPAPKPRESLLLPIVIPLGILAVIGLVLWTFSRVLLRVKPHVATATALIVAASIVAIVAIAASRKRVGNGSLLSVAVGIAGVGMLASGAALLLGTPTGEAGPEVTVAITAPAGAAAAGFAETALTAPSDEPFTITFDNQDPQVQHDVVVASADPAKDPTAQTFVDGAGITGPAQATYPLPALPEGDYYFFCKFHPATMTGTLSVKPGATPGGGGGPSTEITASGLAFDTSTLTFDANTESTLTFQNNDAGVPHNLAIFTDDTLSKVWFKGAPVTGVNSATYDIPALKPGTYYFHCDFHPDTMNGTVTVTGGGGSPPPSGGGSPPPSSPPPSGPPASGSAPPPSGGTTVTASGLAFDVASISLPASAASTITFDNQDAGVQHNIAIYTDESVTVSKFVGAPVTGIATQDYQVPALDAGTYYFRCDYHPDTMHGTVTVG